MLTRGVRLLVFKPKGTTGKDVGMSEDKWGYIDSMEIICKATVKSPIPGARQTVSLIFDKVV